MLYSAGVTDTADRAEDTIAPEELRQAHSSTFFRTKLIRYSTSDQFYRHDAMPNYKYEATEYG